jgi:hypothetical protein
MQLLKIWDKVKEDPKNDPIKLRREVLWKNKHIKINKKEVFYKDWSNKGIVMFHDILKENGEFKSVEELALNDNAPEVTMKYNALKSAIPANWKREVKKMRVPKQTISNEEKPFLVCNNRTLALSITVNKDVYWELVTRKLTRPIAALKWCTEFNIDECDWKTVFKSYTNTDDTKLKAFQFKVLNNILPCNLYLKRIGKSDTDKCPRCNLLEDINHYLFDCPSTLLIWQQLSRWWKDITKQDITLNKRNVMLGLYRSTEKVVMEDQLNEIIMVTKFKIHANKKLGEETCLYQILHSIRYMLKIHEVIANRNLKMQKHEEKWGLIEDALT